MTTLQLPEPTGPDEPYIEYYAMQCRTCRELGPWLNVTDTAGCGHLWDARHLEATGHRRYYRWTVTRGTALVTL